MIRSGLSWRLASVQVMPNLRSLNPFLRSSSLEKGAGKLFEPPGGPSIENSGGRSDWLAGGAASGVSADELFLPRGAAITTNRIKPMVKIQNVFPLSTFGSWRATSTRGES